MPTHTKTERKKQKDDNPQSGGSKFPTKGKSKKKRKR